MSEKAIAILFVVVTLGVAVLAQLLFPDVPGLP
jgi:hypothetical protein